MKRRRLNPIIKKFIIGAIKIIAVIILAMALTITGLIMASENHYRILESYEAVND